MVRVGPGISADDVSEWVIDGLEEHLWCALRRLYAQRVAESAGIFDGAPRINTGHAYQHRPAGGLEFLQECRGISVANSRRDALGGEWPEGSE